jgi:DNA mismatch repair ATPase MutL
MSDIIPIEDIINDKFNFNKFYKSNKPDVIKKPSKLNQKNKPNESSQINSSSQTNAPVQSSQSNMSKQSSQSTTSTKSSLPNSSNRPSQSNTPSQSSQSQQSKKNKDQNQEKTLNGNIGLNPNYERIDPNHSNYTYVPIVGIDDVHGLFFPKINNMIIGNKSLIYKTGGLEYITKYINILRKEFGAHRVLFFDGGDFYQGGIDSVLFDGEIMQDFYNLVGLNGSTIGNHEFDYSREWIEAKIKKGNYKILINNIMDNSTQKKEGSLGENHKTSHIYTVKLENGDLIKIGVIGLSYNMKNDKKIPNTWGNRPTWDNISFFFYMEGL